MGAAMYGNRAVIQGNYRDLYVRKQGCYTG